MDPITPYELEQWAIALSSPYFWHEVVPFWVAAIAAAILWFKLVRFLDDEWR